MKRLGLLVIVAFVFPLGCTVESTAPPVNQPFQPPTYDIQQNDTAPAIPDTQSSLPDTKPPGTDTNPTGETFCVPGYTFCNSDTLFLCVPDGSSYQSQICPNGCLNGQCKTNCTPGTATCLDINTAGICLNNGTYQQQKCAPGTACSNGQCTSQQTLCTPNALFCEAGGAKLLKCSSDGKSAIDYQVCPYGCDPQKLECKTAQCTPGQTQCSQTNPKVVETCAPDASGYLQSALCPYKCENGVCVNPVCTPGELKCEGGNVAQCKADQSGFSSVATCSNGCVLNPSGTPVCAKCQNGDMVCDGWNLAQCTDPTGATTATGYTWVQDCPGLTICGAGKCVSYADIPGDSLDSTYSTLLKEFVACWNQGVTGVCKALDTSAVSGSISVSGMQSWFCDSNGPKDELKALFDSTQQYDQALDLLGKCGGLLDFDLTDITMKNGSITPGLFLDEGQDECFAWQPDSNNKEIVVDRCVNF